MSYRKSTNSALDSKIFSKTAQSTKTINVVPKIMRGGTRL